jgi:hypothetical protein
MANNTIIIRTRQRWTKERAAGGAITPGHLIEKNASDEVVVHATAAGAVAQTAFALEDQAQGRGIDDAYAAGERVVYQVFTPGEEVYAILENGANVAIGAALESNGAGELQARTTGQVVAFALEAVNASGGATRIKVEVA